MAIYGYLYTFYIRFEHIALCKVVCFRLIGLNEVYLGHQQKSQNGDPRSDFLLWST